MEKVYLSYTYRIYPTRKQEDLIKKTFGCCRQIFNWGLQLKESTYFEKQKSLSYFDIKSQVPDFEEDHPWVKNVPEEALDNALYVLYLAYKNHFKYHKELPVFKTRSMVQSFRIQKNFKVDFDTRTLTLPKIGSLVVEDRMDNVPGEVRFVTIKRSLSGNYYAIFCVQLDDAWPQPLLPNPFATIGIDMGIHNLIVCSNGVIYENKHFYQQGKSKIANYRKQLSTMDKGSNRYQKVFKQMMKAREAIVNRRKDYYNKITYELTHQSQINTIVVETLDVQAMIKGGVSKELVYDASFTMFLNMLKFKCKKNGINLIEIDRFEPTSKTCNNCGYVNNSLTLSDRQWVCPQCHKRLDRDLNAAYNIRDLGIKKIETLKI